MKHVPGWKVGESVYKTKVTWIPPRCIRFAFALLLACVCVWSCRAWWLVVVALAV